MEDFVPFDLAVKLKEKGFKEKVNAYYGKFENLFDVHPALDMNDCDYRASAPTISQVLKWLREKKGIHICISCSIAPLANWEYEIVEIDGVVFVNADYGYSTYEESALAGIEYVFNNLIMTQEEKDLLIKDLCARLPYGVKAVLTRTNCHDSIGKISEKDIYSFRTGRPLEEDYGQHDYYKVIVTDIKPYLFPLESMTEEQTEELIKLINTDQNDNNEFMRSLCRIEFYHKHHIDYRGLIHKGSAIDATNKNIY